MIIKSILFVLLLTTSFCMASFDQAERQNLSEVYIPADGVELFCRTTGEGTPQTVYEKPYNLHDSLKGLNIPTLIIHGDYDPIPPSTAHNLHMSIPGSKYILLENCGHFPFVESPYDYFKAINDFLIAN